MNYLVVFVVVNHITIVAIEHGLSKKFWPMVYALQGVSLFETMQTPLLKTTQFLPHPGHE